MDSSILMSAIMVLIFVTMIPVAIGVSRRARAKELESARELASALGLDLVSGEESFRIACEEAGQDSGMAQIAKMPAFLRKWLIEAASWRIHGERGGVRVAVYTETRSSGKNSTTYTVARAYFRALPYALTVSREGAFTKLGKALFNLQDVELGDQELDPLVRIKAGDPLSAKLLLGRSEVSRALLELASQKLDFQVKEDRVHWERRGTHLDPGEIGIVLDYLVPLARLLGEA